MLEQEAVELRLGQRIDALLLDRILGRDDHEAVGQPVGLAVDGDRALLHRLEQGRLGLGRGAVDLVGEQQLAEDRAAGQGELAGLEVEQVGAEDVARHQVRGELDAAEIEPEHPREALGEEGLGRARRPFEQDVARGEEGDQHQLDRLVLADDGLGHVAAGSRRRGL